MNPTLGGYAFGIWMAAASSSALALPILSFSVVGDSGFPGQPVVVTLNHDVANTLDSATVLVQFDKTRLKFVSSLHGSLFPGSTSPIENLADVAAGRAIVSLSSGDLPLLVTGGSILDVNFDILITAKQGAAEVSFRCVPDDSQALAVDAVQSEADSDQFCPDYAIPPIVGFVNVLAPASTGIPIAGTAWLALLGCGLMGLLRRNRRAQAEAREGVMTSP